MSKEHLLRVNDAAETVDELVARLGLWTTLKAVLLAAWQQRRTRTHISHLSDRMLRDIGQTVRKPLPGQPLIPPWFPRF